MRRAAAVLLLVALTLAVVAPPAEACLECVALGLASFAVFTQLVSALTAPPVVYAAPAYYPPAYYPDYKTSVARSPRIWDLGPSPATQVGRRSAARCSMWSALRS